jgi:hypothetical protein
MIGASSGTTKALLVKILISWVAPSGNVSVKTMTVMFASITPVDVELTVPGSTVIAPPDEIDTVPVPVFDDPSLPVQENEDVPFVLIARMSFSQKGASGPETKPSPCHVPTKSAGEYEAACLVKTKRVASSAVVVAPLVPTMIVLPASMKDT